jgi:hypothetical protein
MVGQTISHYRITAKLGEGGMGAVYRAEDTKLQREVALKFLPGELAADREARKRLVKEARAASRLNHPNIGTIYEVNDEGDTPFIAMELVKGESLKQMLQRGAVRAEQLLEIARQIGEGLSEAHRAGVLHRDAAQDFASHRDDLLVKRKDGLHHPPVDGLALFLDSDFVGQSHLENGASRYSQRDRGRRCGGRRGGGEREEFPGAILASVSCFQAACNGGMGDKIISDASEAAGRPADGNIGAGYLAQQGGLVEFRIGSDEMSRKNQDCGKQDETGG